MAMASDTAIAVNSLGVHPECFTPSLAICASLPRWRLHGVASLHVEETPTSGLSRSTSFSPIALNMALCGALDGPSTTVLLGSTKIYQLNWINTTACSYIFSVNLAPALAKAYVI